MTKVKRSPMTKLETMVGRLNKVPFSKFMNLVQHKHDVVDHYVSLGKDKKVLEVELAATLQLVSHILENPEMYPEVTMKDLGNPFNVIP